MFLPTVLLVLLTTQVPYHLHALSHKVPSDGKAFPSVSPFLKLQGPSRTQWASRAAGGSPASGCSPPPSCSHARWLGGARHLQVTQSLRWGCKEGAVSVFSTGGIYPACPKYGDSPGISWSSSLEQWTLRLRKGGRLNRVIQRVGDDVRTPRPFCLFSPAFPFNSVASCRSTAFLKSISLT